MRSPLRTTALAAVALAVVAGTAGCGRDGAAGDGKLSVVTSTDVWGDIAATIGGDRVTVTSLIDDPSADPHSFEASPRTQLAVSRADLLVENGGGYDDFMDTLRRSTDTDAALVNAVDVSGKEAAAGAELNEHVWYDFPTVEKVADRIEAALAKADPDGADTYSAHAGEFTAQLDTLVQQEAAAKATTQGVGVAITEPVPGYLLDALGAVDRTPAEFSEAIEEGDDVSPAVLQRTLALFSSHAVQALVYNEQTTGAETEQVLKAARDDGVAVVPVTETLPAGDSYLSWMRKNLAAVSKALSS